MKPLTRRHKKKEFNLTPAVRTALEAGRDIFGAFDHLSPAAVERELDKLWKIHGAEVLAVYIARFPTQRPDLWWKHDAPARRPAIAEYDGNDFAAFERARKRQRAEEVSLLVRYGLLTREEQR